MSIVIDDKKITNINISNKNVQKIVDELTGKIIFEKTSSNEYFYIENTYNGSNTISLITTIGSGNITGSHATQLQYSKDKKTWTTITLNGTNTISMLSGERVYFRNDSGSFNWYYIPADSFYTQINCSNYHKVGGNINSLLDYNNYNVAITPYCFYNLFYKNEYLTDASELIFSKTSLAIGCYSWMFNKCTSLTSAPKLPSTTLAEYCYNGMFGGCTSLTTAPALPATTLARSCYNGMFSICTALTSAPKLPATTLAIGCYQSMFGYCENLTTPPELPATTIARFCYEHMFQGCKSLTTAPALPAKTLEYSCYNSMFYGCTSLTTAPALPAKTLAESCYYYMFQNCASLNSITVYADDISALNCTTDWLSNVASSGTFHNLGSATYPRNGNGIPTGWTEVKN